MRQPIATQISCGLLAILSLSSSGCALFPEALQPSQLLKLNRGAGPTTDPWASIPDTDATARQVALRNALEGDSDNGQDQQATANPETPRLANNN